MISGSQIRVWSWKSGKAAASPACARPDQSRRFSIVPRLSSRRASDFADAKAARRVMLTVRLSEGSVTRFPDPQSSCQRQFVNPLVFSFESRLITRLLQLLDRL